MPTQNNKTGLDLLNAVGETVISQAALGEKQRCRRLVNFMMKRAIGKGLVTVKKVPARRYAYLLTPKGFAEKARLVADYMNTSMGMFRKVRADFADIFSGSVSSDSGAAQFVVVGDLEMAEVALLEALAAKLIWRRRVRPTEVILVRYKFSAMLSICQRRLPTTRFSSLPIFIMRKAI